MKRATRGSTVTIIANTFLDHTGAAVTPSTVSFRLDYPANNRVRAQTTLNATNSSGTWSASWDSSVAYPGTVFVSAFADSDDNIVQDDQFQLTANQANPNPPAGL